MVEREEHANTHKRIFVHYYLLTNSTNVACHVQPKPPRRVSSQEAIFPLARFTALRGFRFLVITVLNLSVANFIYAQRV